MASPSAYILAHLGLPTEPPPVAPAGMGIDDALGVDVNLGEPGGSIDDGEAWPEPRVDEEGRAPP